MHTETLLLTKLHKEQIGAFYVDNELTQIYLPGENGYEITDIYIGKVKNLVPAIDAAFVEFKKGILGFLSLKNLHYDAVLTKNEKCKLRCGDEILVQIEKEPIKTKEATLTTDLAFSGEYFVIAPFSKGIHYSKKFSESDRSKMWDVMTEIVPLVFGQLTVFLEKYGIIVRTNAILASKNDLLRELHDLFHKTSEVLSVADKRTVFSCIYTDASFFEKIIKNQYKSDILQIVTDEEYFYDDCMKKGILKVRLYQDSMLSLPKVYGLEQKLREAISKQIWLKSGGYLIIEPTEAMVVIDVNSGKAIPKTKQNSSKDSFAYEMNMEAAKEIARQLRLRNLSGMIIIDFISMQDKRLQDALLASFSALLDKDPVETVLVDMTALGLVEVTRKKTSAPIHERLQAVLKA